MESEVELNQSNETNPQNNLEVQQQFALLLDKLRPTKNLYILDTDAMLANLNHEGMISSTIPAPEQNGLHLNSDFTTILQNKNKIPHRINFKSAPLRAIGRENSRNQVFFGNLTLNNFSANNTESLPIAIKPFIGKTRQKAALNELVMSEYLDSLGIDSYRQIGVVKDQNDLYLISIYEPEVITLDSID